MCAWFSFRFCSAGACWFTLGRTTRRTGLSLSRYTVPAPLILFSPLPAYRGSFGWVQQYVYTHYACLPLHTFGPHTIYTTRHHTYAHTKRAAVAATGSRDYRIHVHFGLQVSSLHYKPLRSFCIVTTFFCVYRLLWTKVHCVLRSPADTTALTLPHCGHSRCRFIRSRTVTALSGSFLDSIAACLPFGTTRTFFFARHTPFMPRGLFSGRRTFSPFFAELACCVMHLLLFSPRARSLARRCLFCFRAFSPPLHIPAWFWFWMPSVTLCRTAVWTGPRLPTLSFCHSQHFVLHTCRTRFMVAFCFLLPGSMPCASFYHRTRRSGLQRRVLWFGHRLRKLHAVLHQYRTFTRHCATGHAPAFSTLVLPLRIATPFWTHSYTARGTNCAYTPPLLPPRLRSLDCALYGLRSNTACAFTRITPRLVRWPRTPWFSSYGTCAWTHRACLVHTHCACTPPPPARLPRFFLHCLVLYGSRPFRLSLHTGGLPGLHHYTAHTG